MPPAGVDTEALIFDVAQSMNCSIGCETCEMADVTAFVADDATQSRKKFEIELMRQIDQVTSQCFRQQEQKFCSEAN